MTITKPRIPGTVIRFTGESIPRIPPSFADTVAVVVTSDWGPLMGDAAGAGGKQGGPQLVTSFAEYTALFGDDDTDGRTAAAETFAGQGFDGAPGAGAAWVVRTGANAAAATHTIQNTTPANALTLRAKYKGTRGNRLSYSIAADPNNAANDVLSILFDGAVVEHYSYARADIAALAAAINLRSPWVVAVETVTGVALTATAGTALAGGTDGDARTSGDVLAALAALEFKPFSILTFDNLTDSSIQAATLSWIQTQDNANRPVMWAVGGDSNDTIDTAIARSAALADWHVVNLGVGDYHDDLLDKDLSTAQLAPRIAGILAALGEDKSLTFRKIAGLHANTGPESDEVESAVQMGVTVLAQTIAADADLHIVQGVTTFTSTTDPAHPVDVFGDPRLVRVMDIYVRGMKQWGDDNIIGGRPVNDDTRSAVRGEARRRQDALLARGLILPGDGVTVPKPFVIVDDPGDPALADAIPYQFGWQFARTANYILGEGKVR